MSDYFTTVDAWSATLLRAAWHGGLAVLVVWLIVRLLPSMPARHRAWLWRLAVLKFAILLVVAAPVSIPLLSAPELPEIPVEPLAETAISPGVRESISQAEHFSSPSAAAPAQSYFAVSFVAVWSIIAVAGWWRLLYAALAASRQRRLCRPLKSAVIDEQLVAMTRRFGLKKAPNLLEVEGRGSPLLVGLFRPAVVFPTATLRSLNEAERNLALGHELAHAARRDLPWSVFAATVRALYWFHPLAWLCERELRLSQELAADELAVAEGVADPILYGRSLASIVEKLSPTGRIPTLSLGTAGPVHSLEQRIRAMNRIGSASRFTPYFSLLLVGLAAVVGIVPWKLTAAEADPEPRSAQAIADEKVSAVLKSADFWKQTGAKVEHPELTAEDTTALQRLAGSATDDVVRLRAYKLLTDLDARSRYAKEIEPRQLAAGIEDVFRYLETHLAEEKIKLFSPEYGFSHLAVNLRTGDPEGIVTLIEYTDGVLPSGGLSIYWNAKQKSVDRIDYWGATLEARRAALKARNAKEPAKVQKDGAALTLEGSAGPSQDPLPLLGELMADGVKRCGEPQSETVLASGIVSRTFQIGAMRVIAEYSPKTKRTVQVYYFTREPLTGLYVNYLLGLNSGGLEWSQTKTPVTDLSFVRSDGAQTRGSTQTHSLHHDGKFYYMFAFLAADEVKRAKQHTDDAKAAAEQARKQAETAAKEIADAHRQAEQAKERIANGVQALPQVAPPKVTPRGVAHVVILKGSQEKPDRDLSINTNLAFEPGKRSEFQVAAVKTNERSFRVEMTFERLPEVQAKTYRIETRIIDDTDPKQPKILSAPKLVTVAGREATISVGSTEDLLQVHITIEERTERMNAAP